MRGRYDPANGGYVVTDQEAAELARRRRREETHADSWATTHPRVSASYGCDVCSWAEQWDEEAFYIEFATIPLTVAAAREYEDRISPCGAPGHPVELDEFTLWAPEDPDEQEELPEPLVDWSSG